MKQITVKGLVLGLILLLYLLFVALLCNIVKADDEPTVKTIHYEKTEVYNAVPIDNFVTETFEKGNFITMKTTAYCPCEICCGWSTGITASGTTATAGRTVAANLNYYPIGTRFIINGIEYTVEDTGGGVAANQIDIFFNDHQEALNYGVRYIDVKILED